MLSRERGRGASRPRGPALACVLADGDEIAAHAVVRGDRGASTGGSRCPGPSSSPGAASTTARRAARRWRCSGERVFVVGGANSAGQAALYFARFAEHVTILCRGAISARACPSTSIERSRRSPNIAVRAAHRAWPRLHGEASLEPRSPWPTGRPGPRSASRRGAVVRVHRRAAAAPTGWRACVARDERGFILTGPDLGNRRVRRPRWPLSAPAAAAGDRASRASSRPATCATSRSSGWRPPSARARWPCSSCTSTSGGPSRSTILRQVDLFAELSDACLGRLAAAAREERHRAGEWLVAGGETPPTASGILTDGLDRVGARWSTGRRWSLGSRARGHLCGRDEPADRASPTGRRANGRPTASWSMIPGDEFRRLLHDEPSVMHGALRDHRARPSRGRTPSCGSGRSWSRSGPSPPGWRTSSTIPAAAARRSAGELAEGVPGAPRRGPRVRVERGRARPGRAAGGPAAGGPRPGRGRGGGGRRPARLPPTARTRWSTRSTAQRARGLAPGPGAGRGRARRRTGSNGWRERGGPALGARGRVGRRLALGAGARSASCTRARRASRRSSARSRSTRTWTGRRSRRIDVHDGLESTLTILAHKLKRGDRRWSATTTARCRGSRRTASELNQVWTNLIDNAIDAMDGDGHGRASAPAARRQVLVEIVDDGPGIPPERAEPRSSSRSSRRRTSGREPAWGSTSSAASSTNHHGRGAR